jgi:hypothetical protein
VEVERTATEIRSHYVEAVNIVSATLYTQSTCQHVRAWERAHANIATSLITRYYCPVGNLVRSSARTFFRSESPWPWTTFLANSEIDHNIPNKKSTPETASSCLHTVSLSAFLFQYHDELQYPIRGHGTEAAAQAH